MTQFTKTITELWLHPSEIDFCWMLHEGKSCREISEETFCSFKRCNAIKSSILRKLGVGKLEQLRKLTKEELNTLINSKVKVTHPRDYKAYDQANEAKKERQLQVWENEIPPQDKELLKIWFARKSTYLLKKDSALSLQEIQQIIKKANQLIEAGKSPLGYSLKDLSRMSKS